MGVMVSNDRLWWSKFIFPEFDAVLNLAQRVSLKYQANFKEAFDIFYNEELIKFSDLNVWYIQEYGWIIEPWPEEVEVKKKKATRELWENEAEKHFGLLVSSSIHSGNMSQIFAKSVHLNDAVSIKSILAISSQSAFKGFMKPG